VRNLDPFERKKKMVERTGIFSSRKITSSKEERSARGDSDRGLD
jgi:hypothetical protein